MSQDFQRRKQDILKKEDKSYIQRWDSKIIKLCERINKKSEYYTTSSCSGRIVIMIDQDKKSNGLFIKTYHSKITFKKLKEDLLKIALLRSDRKDILIKNKQIKVRKNGQGSENYDIRTDESYYIDRCSEEKSDIATFEAINRMINREQNIIKFKQEPCILHVACENLEKAQDFYDKARLAGWKKYGIIASGKRFVVEITGTGRLEFPIIKKGELLVNDDFLKLIVKQSNEKLEKSWECIEKLRKLI